MEISISLAAGSYMAYLKARTKSQIDKVCMTRISRENNEYKVVNPEFSVMQDAAETNPARHWRVAFNPLP